MPGKTPYQIFAEKMLHPGSKYIPEILKCMISDSQAQLLVNLPGTAQELSEKTEIPMQEAEKDLNDMFRKGLVFKKTKDNVTKWRPPMHIAQFHDASIVWPEAPPEFYDLWQAYMEKEWPDIAQDFVKMLPRPFTRVIPVEKPADPGRAKILAPENIKEIIDNASRIAVVNCTCRLTMRNCDSPIEVCLQINRGADYTIERGSGRKVSKEEAHDILRKAREAGLVHVAMNKAEGSHFICNCCGCCCQAFTLLISDGLNLCDPSRFQPVIDNDLCVLCGDCVDRCWFNALKIDNDSLTLLPDKCMGCGQCATACPQDAIALEEIRYLDFIPV